MFSICRLPEVTLVHSRACHVQTPEVAKVGLPSLMGGLGRVFKPNIPYMWYAK